MKRTVSLIIVSILAALLLGCNTQTAPQSVSVPAIPEHTASSAETEYTAYLNPGWFIAPSKTVNTVSGAAKLTATEEKEMWLENAYKVSLTEGTALPEAETANTKVEFGGWQYAENGVLVKLDKMPAVSGLILYAVWNKKGNGGSGGDGNCTIMFELPNWSPPATSPKIHLWNAGGDVTTFPGVNMTLVSGRTYKYECSANISGIIISFTQNGATKQSIDLTPAGGFADGATYTVTSDYTSWNNDTFTATIG